MGGVEAFLHELDLALLEGAGDLHLGPEPQENRPCILRQAVREVPAERGGIEGPARPPAPPCRRGRPVPARRRHRHSPRRCRARRRAPPRPRWWRRSRPSSGRCRRCGRRNRNNRVRRGASDRRCGTRRRPSRKRRAAASSRCRLGACSLRSCGPVSLRTSPTASPGLAGHAFDAEPVRPAHRHLALQIEAHDARPDEASAYTRAPGPPRRACRHSSASRRCLRWRRRTR